MLVIVLLDSRQQLPAGDPFALYWEGAKGVQPQEIKIGGVKQVGEVVILPQGVHILGMPGKGNRYYRRRSYRRIRKVIVNFFAGGQQNWEVLVSGNPGGGKTWLANELLHHFQQGGLTIVYENQEQKYRWLLSPNGPIFRGGFDCFRFELQNPATIYICDCGKDQYRNPEIVFAKTIVLSSPNKQHYDGWLNEERNILRLFLPLWSLEEVRAVEPAVYPIQQSAQIDSNGNKMKDANGADIMVNKHEQRFQLFGGSARFIFSPLTDDVLLEELHNRIQTCNLPAVIKSASTNLKLVLPMQDVTWRLLRIEVEEDDAAGQPYYQSVKLDFISDYVLGRLVSRKENEYQNQLVELLREAGESVQSDTSSLRGKVFERYSLNQLAEGGVFRARWLKDPLHSDMWLSFSSVTQKGILNSLTGLHAGEMALLLKPNFRTIDGAIRRHLVHLLQMTISKSHTINLLGLHSAMQDLNVINAPNFALLYFVVPPSVYPLFANPTPVTEGLHNALPNNVHLLVLEMSLPETVGSRRKAPAAGPGGAVAVIDSDSLVPPPSVPTICNCNSSAQGCTAVDPHKLTRHCACLKAFNKCCANCTCNTHVAAANPCRN